ncbi:MAG: tripartite tricarboxylate transporter substrate binding protein [Sphaerochaetaceae bacterium]
MKKLLVLLVCVLAFAGTLWANGTAETAVYPDRPVEFVIPGSAGGGSDILGRTIADIIRKNNLVDQTITIVNKGGGASAVAHGYVNAKSDVDYYLLTCNSANMLSMHVNQSMSPKGPFTPIANMAMDDILLVARSDGQFPDWKSVEAAIKANPESLTVGLADDLDAMALALLEENVGVDFNTTAYFSSSGEVATALLGGHLDLAILNPVECVGLVEGGRLIGIGSFAPNAMEAPFDKTPTFTALGYPKVMMQMSRSVIGPAGMSEEVQQYWSEVLQKVSETEEWKVGYIERNVLQNQYMNAEDFTKYYSETEKTLLDFAKKLEIL